MKDWFPEKDPLVGPFLTQFDTAAKANAQTLNIGQTDLTKLAALPDQWTASLAAVTAAENALKVAVQNKNALLEGTAGYVRGLGKQLQANPAMTDAIRAAFGLTVPGAHPPAPPVTTRPTLELDTSQRLQITIAFHNEGATNKAKPPGVRGCQIWEFIGTPAPVDTTGMTYVATDTRTPHVVTFAGTDAGKPVSFIGRWEMNDGTFGPLSEVVSAVVPG